MFHSASAKTVINLVNSTTLDLCPHTIIRVKPSRVPVPWKVKHRYSHTCSLKGSSLRDSSPSPSPESASASSPPSERLTMLHVFHLPYDDTSCLKHNWDFKISTDMHLAIELQIVVLWSGFEWTIWGFPFTCSKTDLLTGFPPSAV